MSLALPRSSRPLLFAAVASIALFPGCSAIGESCTLAGCLEGVQVDFTFREAGAYVVTVMVDGQTTTCRASLPLSASDPGCDGAPGAVTLATNGSALPASEQSLGGLGLATKEAKSISVTVTRDGNVVGEKTFAPAYDTRPGPNGPDCDPPTCTFARETLSS